MLSVEAALRLVPQHPALNHVREKHRRAKHLALFVIGQRVINVLDDMAEDIKAYKIKCAEGRSLRATDSLPRHLVNLFDSVAFLQHRLDCMKRAERAYSIGYKIRTVFSGHDTFAQALIQKSKHRARNFGL